MGWLLDTNVLFEIRRPRPEPKVLEFTAARPLEHLYISAATMVEFRFGIELLREGRIQRVELSDWLTHTIRTMFDGRILPITEDGILLWRQLVEDGRKAGHTYSQPGLIIAATAMEKGLMLVTRNCADFTKAGVAMLDPWNAS